MVQDSQPRSCRTSGLLGKAIDNGVGRSREVGAVYVRDPSNAPDDMPQSLTCNQLKLNLLQSLCMLPCVPDSK